MHSQQLPLLCTFKTTPQRRHKRRSPQVQTADAEQASEMCIPFHAVILEGGVSQGHLAIIAKNPLTCSIAAGLETPSACTGN